MEEKLTNLNGRIQRRNNLNSIAVDLNSLDANNVPHRYVICNEKTAKKLLDVNFQKGPRNVESSISGVLEPDLLEIVRDRLRAHQKTAYATAANEHALRHIEEALMWMCKRVEDRAERGVLGTTKL